MSDGGHELIIIKRHDEEEHEHHSSAWKVAHADFMTAMMAFFLIMWLINVTDDEVRKGIAQYFNPIHMSSGSSDMKGLMKGDENEVKKNGQPGHNTSGEKAFNPMELSAGGADQKTLAEKAAEASSAAAEAAAAQAAAAKIEAQGAGAGAQQGAAAASAGQGPAAGAALQAGIGEGALQGEGEHAAADLHAAAANLAGGSMAASGSGEARERAAFQDPYAVLARLAEQYALDHPMSASNIAGAGGEIGLPGGEIDRDPFDPVYWQLSPLPPARTPKPGDPGRTVAPPDGAMPDAAAPQTVPQTVDAAVADAMGVDVATAPETTGKASPQAPAAAAPANQPPPSTAAANAPLPQQEAEPAPMIAADNSEKNVPEKDATLAASADIARKIDDSVKEVAGAAGAPALSVEATKEGVVINLTDDASFSMFGIGSAIPDAEVVVLMAKIAGILSEKKGDVILRGYTDGRPFHSESYDNWRLSAARAHMAYYMLRRGGLDEARVVAIEGHADRDLKNPDDPYAAENRRIEILLKGDGQ